MNREISSGTRIFSNKTIAQCKTKHHVLILPRGQKQRVKDASLQKMRQHGLRTMQTTGNAMRSADEKRKAEEKTRQTKASQLDEKDEGKPTKRRTTILLRWTNS